MFKDDKIALTLKITITPTIHAATGPAPLAATNSSTGNLSTNLSGVGVNGAVLPDQIGVNTSWVTTFGAKRFRLQSFRGENYADKISSGLTIGSDPLTDGDLFMRLVFEQTS